MASVTKIRTFSAIQDERIVLSNSQFARPFTIATWTTLRIALRLSMNNTGANIITPAFYVGISSGSTNLIMDATTTHWCGLKTNGTWNYFLAAGGAPTQYYGLNPRATKRVGSTTTDNATPTITTASCIPANAAIAMRCLYFVDITRVGYPGSGSYSFNTKLIYDSGASASNDVSVANFTDKADDVSPTQTSHLAGTAKTLTVDEGTNGVFNHVNCGWDQATPTIEISDLAVVKIA